MKRILIFTILAVFAVACGTEPQTTQEKTTNNVNVAVEQSDNSLTVSSHSQEKVENSSESNGAPSKDTPRKRSPMERSIDVSKETKSIEAAEAQYTKDPKSETAKASLAKSYFDRAFALTEAAQYRTALGDFRKGLKLDPANEPAKKMHDQIISIFNSIKREPPKEGEEPPPLPFEKTA